MPDKQVGVITGVIRHIKEADVWVNSENTNMMMARQFERSVSATIRYQGAKKDQAGRVLDDVIANELRKAAVSYLLENPTSRINRVYFLAYTEQDMQICRHKFIHDPERKFCRPKHVQATKHPIGHRKVKQVNQPGV